MPEQFRNCILVPIPKSSKDSSISDNYRPIALAPTLSKALEWCILLSFSDHFQTSGLQFGFKSNMSTSLCSGTVKNVVARYLHEDSPVYACFLDATKAFDLVNHNILFRRLIDKGFPILLVRFLLFWYKEQQMSIRWGNSFSNSFPVANGVRQGGVLSPILFTLYIDDLLLDLKKLGVGCFWDSFFAGALCYADDLTLLAPTPSALRFMLQHCERFAESRGLRFNPAKTQLIRFSYSPSTKCNAQFSFCGHSLSFVDTVTHLGILLHYNLSDEQDITMKIRDLVKKSNCLFASFPSVGPFVLTKLFQSYCLSLYGCSLWKLSSPAIQNIEIAFNKILRKIWNLPRHSHTRIVHCTANLRSLYNIILDRSRRLLLSAVSSSSTLVKQIYSDSSTVCFTFCGFNSMFGSRYEKLYYPEDRECARVIRDIMSGRLSFGEDTQTVVVAVTCD